MERCCVQSAEEVQFILISPVLARSVAWSLTGLDRLQTLRVVTGQDLVRTPLIVAGEWWRWRWLQGEGRQVMTTTITIVSRLKWSIFAAVCLQ